MIATIYPGKCAGKISVPSSKSLLHRAIICASLAKGKSIIYNVHNSCDIQATITAMQALGAEISQNDTTLFIDGTNSLSNIHTTHINCEESGSTLRFLIPICALINQEFTLYGKGRLMQRPLHEYQTLFEANQLPFILHNNTCTIKGCLKNQNYSLAGNISSQFISGLLFALPLLPFDTTIQITKSIESKSYVFLTLHMLQLFQIDVQFKENTFFIKGNQTYQPTTYTVESDYSQLSFFAVLATLNHSLTFYNVSNTSYQGDHRIFSILRQWNQHICFLENTCKIEKKQLIAHDIDLQDCPDLGPILCVLAAFTKGQTRLYNAKRLRYKESDRIAAMECELKKLGVSITSDEDTIYIQGKTSYEGNVTFHSHNDHRIVMSLAIASCCCEHPNKIEYAQAIEKSYPNFFKDLKSIGIPIELT